MYFKLASDHLIKINLDIKEICAIAEEHGVSKNNDGSYSRRSKKGKEINSHLDALIPKKEQYERELDCLSYAPYESWLDYTTYLSIFKSCYISIAIWVVAYAIICKANDLDAIANFYSYISFGSSEHAVFIIAGVITINFYFLVNAVIKSNIIRSLPPKPPIVDLENLNKY